MLGMLYALAPAVSPAVSAPLLEVAGASVTPHVRAESLRYGADPGKATGALMRLFLRNPRPATENPPDVLNASEVLFDGQYPIRYLMNGDWAWHDTPNLWEQAHRRLPPGALTVWTFNAISPRWSAGRTFTLTVDDWERGVKESVTVSLEKPTAWLSSVTFLGTGAGARLIFHLVNRSGGPVKIVGARLYLPEDPRRNWRVFLPQPPLAKLQTFPADGVIPVNDQGGAQSVTGPLPRTYAVLEVTLTDAAGRAFSVWAKVRIKPETFDIGGGWVGGAAKDGKSALTQEAYLKTLRRLHVNQGHIGWIPGYSDQTGPDGLYTRYPLKYFDGLTPTSQYDTDALLPHIHGVDALGEPQLGFSKDQMLPQEVWKALETYAPTRLPTTVTLNDESNWRYYAGLSDYPHHDNYRVTAPSADAWRRYDRWNGQRIGWGAPLETIGDLQRSLREMSRPAPTAYWSQGPSSGWDVYDGRQRVSPTPDEIRLQAYHALAARITSLYWFNLSLTALVRFRDTLDELTRCGREMRLLEEFYLEGDAYQYRQTRRNGQPDWDLASIAGPQGALLFALDLDYVPDQTEKVFRFGPPRPARFAFALPAYLRAPADVFRIDADGIHEVASQVTPQGIAITDRVHKVAIYVATPDRGLRDRLERKRQALLAIENAVDFDPARRDSDFMALKALMPERE
jgi:hypothetical protein